MSIIILPTDILYLLLCIGVIKILTFTLRKFKNTKSLYLPLFIMSLYYIVGALGCFRVFVDNTISMKTYEIIEVISKILELSDFTNKILLACKNTMLFSLVSSIVAVILAVFWVAIVFVIKRIYFLMIILLSSLTVMPMFALLSICEFESLKMVSSGILWKQDIQLLLYSIVLGVILSLGAARTIYAELLRVLSSSNSRLEIYNYNTKISYFNNYIIPKLMPIITLLFLLDISLVVLLEPVLSYLNLIDINSLITWGKMLADFDFITISTNSFEYFVLILAILGFVMPINILQQQLVDKLNTQKVLNVRY